ncbi:hypothetical protein LY85_0919 [Clostridium sp. KNHs216]|nr:hypothetical protein LY85_0919 [Clostridium sp. KNHs216]
MPNQTTRNFLLLFKRGERISDIFLLRKGFTHNEIKKYKSCGYIAQCGINSSRNNLYVITDLGISARDS